MTNEKFIGAGIPTIEWSTLDAWLNEAITPVTDACYCGVHAVIWASRAVALINEVRRVTALLDDAINKLNYSNE